MKRFLVMSSVFLLFVGVVIMTDYQTITVQDNLGEWHKINYYSIRDLNKKIFYIKTSIFIFDDVVFGENVRLSYGTIIYNDVHIGDNVQIFSCSTINVYTQIGDFVVIGDNVKIGSNVRIGNNVRIENQVKIANGAKIKSLSIVTSDVTK